MDEPGQSRGKRPRVVAPNSGLSIAAGIILFGAIGFALDHRRGGGVTFTVGGILLGLLIGFYELWKIVRKLNEPRE